MTLYIYAVWKSSELIDSQFPRIIPYESLLLTSYAAGKEKNTNRYKDRFPYTIRSSIQGCFNYLRSYYPRRTLVIVCFVPEFRSPIRIANISISPNFQGTIVQSR